MSDAPGNLSTSATSRPASRAAAPVAVLFTHYGDQWIRGSEQLLLDLLGHLDRQRIRPVVWCNGEAFAARVRDMGIDIHRSDFDHYFDTTSPRFSPRRYLALVSEGTRIARANAIQVLHSNSAAPTQWLVPVARRIRAPLLSHLHIAYLRRSRYALLLHQADLAVGVSAQVIEDFLRDGMPAERTAVIYNGIDFARLDTPPGEDLRARCGIGPGAVVIAAVGSLIRRKGHDLLIRAFARLDPATGAHLLIASDGPERAPLEALAAELGLGGRAHFLGYHDDIAGVYRACDVVALASRGDAFGLALAEAGWFARPVVSTRVGGIPEVVDDGTTGLLVPPDDVDALAAALDRLVRDPACRARLGEAGRARVERLFGVAEMTEQFMRTYERLALVPRDRLGWRMSNIQLRPYARMFDRRPPAQGKAAGLVL